MRSRKYAPKNVIVKLQKIVSMGYAKRKQHHTNVLVHKTYLGHPSSRPIPVRVSWIACSSV